MGQIKNIKLHIVTDIKNMQNLTRTLFRNIKIKSTTSYLNKHTPSLQLLNNNNNNNNNPQHGRSVHQTPQHIVTKNDRFWLRVTRIIPREEDIPDELPLGMIKQAYERRRLMYWGGMTVLSCFVFFVTGLYYRNERVKQLDRLEDLSPFPTSSKRK